MHKSHIIAPGADGLELKTGAIAASELIDNGGAIGAGEVIDNGGAIGAGEVIDNGGAIGAGGRELAPRADERERARKQHGANKNEEKVSAQLPQLDCWQGLSVQEREYRSIKLLELERRIQADGPHQARPDAQRARQFMPFAALKGYHELAHSKERWEE